MLEVSKGKLGKRLEKGSIYGGRVVRVVLHWKGVGKIMLLVGYCDDVAHGGAMI